MTDKYTHPDTGVYWLAIDDGEKVNEIVVAELKIINFAPDDQPIVVKFADHSGRYFEAASIKVKRVKPCRRFINGSGEYVEVDDAVNITWLGRVGVPGDFPAIGSAIAGLPKSSL